MFSIFQKANTKKAEAPKKATETFVLGKVSRLTLARQGNINEATIFFPMIWKR